MGQGTDITIERNVQGMDIIHKTSLQYNGSVMTKNVRQNFFESLATPVQKFEEVTQLLRLAEQLLVRSVSLDVIQLQFADALFVKLLNLTLLLVLTF